MKRFSHRECDRDRLVIVETWTDVDILPKYYKCRNLFHALFKYARMYLRNKRTEKMYRKKYELRQWVR